MSFDDTELSDSPPPHGIAITGHWRVEEHEADRLRHDFRRYYEARARIWEATIRAERNRFERADQEARR